MKKLFLLCLLALSVLFASQTNALTPVTGCMDPTAVNYNALATVSDPGSCIRTPILPPTIPDVLLGDWGFAMHDLSSTDRSGNTKFLNMVSFTVNVTKKELSRSEIILTGKMRGGGTVQVYYNPNSSEAQIQTGYWVSSLETGLGFIAIDCSVFTSEDGTSMWGQVTATLYGEDNRKKALYKGDVSFYRNHGGKGGL